MTAAVTYFVFRTSVGAVCLWAGAEKARDLRAFFQGIADYRLLPVRLERPAGIALVVAELGLGGLLVTGLAPAAAAFGAIVLFSVFAAALAISLARSNHTPCHCFGASDVEPVSPVALVRALTLAGIAVTVLVLALGDTGGIPGDTVLPALLMTAALVAATRLSGLFPLTWSFLRAQPRLFPSPTNRVSFRHQPLHIPLYPEYPEDTR